MDFLTRDQMADLRRMSEGAMTSTCSIERTDDDVWVDEGGGAGYWEPGVGGPVTFPCRLAPVSGGDEVEIAERPDILHLVRMTYPIEAGPLRASDKPVIDGVQYEVVGVAPERQLAVERHATLRRVV